MKNRLIYLLLALLVASVPAAAQVARLYTPEDGLINSQVNRICQDARGSIWICTEGGLVRFDGMGFETFRHDRENPNSILSDSVHDFLEDSCGTKWVATASGLALFDSDYNRFRPFDLHDARNASSSQFIGQVVEIPDRVSGSYLYVCTSGNGIYVIDPATQTLQGERRERLYKQLPSEYINMVFADADRHLWVVPIGPAPAVVLDADTLEPATDLRWSPDLAREAGRISITAQAEDPVSHNLLLGTASHGLLIYESATRTVRRARGAGSAAATIAAAIGASCWATRTAACCASTSGRSPSCPAGCPPSAGRPATGRPRPCLPTTRATCGSASTRPACWWRPSPCSDSPTWASAAGGSPARTAPA